MRLREIRKAKGRQQKELAEKIGTDEPMMSKFENYKCLPIPSMMRKLLKELGCSRVEEFKILKGRAKLPRNVELVGR